MIFIGCIFESCASRVGLHKQTKDTASAKKVSFYSQKLECLEFIIYEVVARSVASRPKKDAPLAMSIKKL